MPSRVPLGLDKEEEEEKKEAEKVVSSEKKTEKKSLPKWIIGAGIGVIVIAIFLVIKMLGGKSVKSGKIVTLNYWGMWEEESVMAGVIADFEAKNPNIKINYSKNSYDNYRSRLAGRLKKEGGTEEVPDIFRIHASWLPMFSDYLAPIPKRVSDKIGMEEDFFEVYKRDLKKDGTFMAVPIMYDGLALFYNKKLIEAAGVKLPESWLEFKSTAEKLTVKDERGKIKVAGVAMGMTENVDHWSDIVGLMMKQNGADIKKQDASFAEKLKTVLAFYTLFADGKTWDGDLPNSTQLFASGNLAFYFAPAWRVFNLGEMTPDLDYGIIKVPQLPTNSSGGEGLTDIHWASYWVEAVNNKSEKKEAAFTFLTYLASREGLDLMNKTASQIRAFGEISPRKSMAEALASNPKIKAFVEVADQASCGFTSSRTFDDGLNDEMNTYFKNAINGVVINRATVDKILPDLLNGIAQTTSKYKLNN